MRATHTFLFTDIEGSTRRWQEHGPAMQDALKVHDAVVLDAVDTAGGRVFKHTGDGVCAVFSSPASAARAGMAIVRRLAEEPFEAVGGLAVRIGIHAGEAEERDEDFFGPALNRTARLMGLAHGGQILLSDAAAALLQEVPTSELELRDLGEHPLRDIDRPERVHQVVAEALPTEFPALRSTPQGRIALPQPRTPFVGRAKEVSELVSLLGERRAVTLVGIGGTGKTRLALEAARRAAPLFPGGAYFVDLSSITDGSLVLPTLAGAVGLPGTEAGGLSVADAVVGLLSTRRALVVLDNCEQIIEDCAEAVDTLLDGCPEIVVLATSREALGVEGEHSWPVASLRTDDPEVGAGTSEAVQLFVERARSAAGSFDLSADTVGPVAEICRRLDGIPLAIELAASRVSHMTPADIAAHLDDRFRLLVGGGRRRAQRQQTLQAALDWSHDLLAPAEQVLLRRLSVFTGGFTTDTAAAVCLDDGDGSVLDLLGSLVAKSLVAAEPGASGSSGTRYRMLETMRLYAAQKLVEAGEAERFRTRHRDRYVSSVESYRIDETLLDYTVITPLTEDFDNLRAALDWSEAEPRPDLFRRLAMHMAGTWSLWGSHDEGMARLKAAAEAADDPREQAEALAVLSFVAMVAAAFEVMNDAALRSIELDPEGQLSGLALLLAGLFRVYEREGADDLHDIHERARLLAHRHGLPLLASMAVGFVAHRYVVEGAFDKVASLDEDVPSGLTYQTFVFGGAFVVAAICSGRAELAVRHVQQIPSLWYTSYYLRVLEAMALIEAGRRGEARDAVQLAAKEMLEQPAPLGVGECLIAYAALALDDGDPARATALLEAVFAEHGMASYRSPSSWVMSRRYRYQAKERLEGDAWDAARAEGRRRGARALLEEEFSRYA